MSNFRQILLDEIYSETISEIKGECLSAAKYGKFFVDIPLRRLKMSEDTMKFVVSWAERNDLSLQILDPDEEEEFLWGKDSKVMRLFWT